MQAGTERPDCPVRLLGTFLGAIGFEAKEGQVCLCVSVSPPSAQLTAWTEEDAGHGYLLRHHDEHLVANIRHRCEEPRTRTNPGTGCSTSKCRTSMEDADCGHFWSELPSRG